MEKDDMEFEELLKVTHYLLTKCGYNDDLDDNGLKADYLGNYVKYRELKAMMHALSMFKYGLSEKDFTDWDAEYAIEEIKEMIDEQIENVNKELETRKFELDS